MLDYVEYINKILEENAKTSFVSSMLTYENDVDEISAYHFIEAYYSKLNDVKEEINKFFDNLKLDVDQCLVPIFNNTKITNVTYEEDDDSYVFELNSKEPIEYNIELRLRNLKGEEISSKKTNKRGELVLRKNDNDYSDYELSIVDNEYDQVGFTIAAIFYENASEDLFDLLSEMEKTYYTHLFYTPKVDINLPLSIELYDGKITIYYTGANNRHEIMNIDEKGLIDENGCLKMQSTFMIERFCEELKPFASDPVWFLDNIYIKANDYILNNLGGYNDDNHILCNMFMKAGYGNKDGFRDNYCDDESWSEDGEKYYISNNEGIREIKNYASVKENDDDTFTFTFLDDSVLVIPTNQVIYVSPQEEDKETMALLALRGRL